MGGETTGINKQPDIENIRNSGSDGSTSAAPAKTGTGASTGTEAGTIAGTDTGTEKETIPFVVDVSHTKLSREERNARRRAKYAEKKAEEGKNVKPRKVNATKTKKEDTALNVTELIYTIFGIAGSRPGLEYWELTKGEAEALGKPLSNMIAKSSLSKELGEHSDAVALAVASVTVLAPRAFVAIGNAKKNIERKKENADRRTNNDDADRQYTKFHGGEIADDDTSVGDWISQILPATAI